MTVIITALVPFLFLGGFMMTARSIMNYYIRYKGHSKCEAWFDEYKEKEAYEAIKQANNVGRHHVMASLLLRAKACVHRLHQVEMAKPALSELFQRQYIDQLLWQSLLEAEQLMVSEVASIVQEAKQFHPAWSRTIFVTALHMWEYEKLALIPTDVQRDYRPKAIHFEKLKNEYHDDDDDDLFILNNVDDLD
ncbi:Pre protein translocase subunit Sec66-domain-containing protein [Halteromyces radiatus]|uniref:Pre protein translocase subunit Sec66-domain-containing protein n=1 Tax=Halteromyces radiatus TaxID=101107 RepID=UPI002220C15F|nr:Pre protein translocase subunit Sec66-domain-containing protein [Halteromyces radiatus]KAI8083126.1 Pre protein translocase subunit Sec66-domain-containing protein [Halteromyces radiatus]